MPSSDNHAFLSPYAPNEAPLDLDPQNPFWLAAPSVSVDCDPLGQRSSGIWTSIRSRWTTRDLFVLFECRYEALYLRPHPQRAAKTWELWNWDVVELFIGDDWEHIERYKEFELSPQGEWLDLAIDRTPPDLERNREWASGFESAARIDSDQRVWYGGMRIPFAAITKAKIEEGKRFRANLYRIEGPPEQRKLAAWRATGSDDFHVPAAFGNLVLGPTPPTLGATSHGRRLTRRSLLGTALAAPALPHSAFGDDSVPRPHSPKELREMFERYLNQKAAGITDSCLREVVDLPSWQRLRPLIRKQTLSMLGLDPLPVRTPLRARTTGVLERDRYRIEKVVFESMPGLYVTASLYLPETSRPAPAIVYLCGHNPSPAGAKHGYQHQGVALARLGFVTLLVDTVEFCEVPGIHHGIYNLEMWQWLSLGYTPAGVEVWNGMRAIDYLATRPEVDIQKLGVTGISGGGIVSWYLPALDDRVAAVASVCGSWTAGTQLELRAVQENCDCVYFPNRFCLDLPAIGALIAPRPFKILGALHDEMFPPAGYHDVHRRVGRIYELYRAGDRIALYEHDAPHQDIPAFRKQANEWLNLWLRGDRTPFDEPAFERESPESLRVLEKLPANAVNDHIDRTFISIPEIPPQHSIASWERRKSRLSATLRAATFSSFPNAAPPPDAIRSQVQEWTARYADAFRIEFTTEPGLRLAGHLYVPRKAASTGAVIWLEGDDDVIDPVNHDRILPALGRNVVLVLQPRAVGYGLDPQHLTTIKRSVAILGATLESMQVWDALRGLDYLIATQPQPFESITLFARRNAAVPAIYAAALDPRITRVVLEDPPSSHWNGPAMMNVLRTTDLAEVAAMIAPRQLVFLARPPSEFNHTRAIYGLYGRESAFRQAAGFTAALELA